MNIPLEDLPQNQPRFQPDPPFKIPDTTSYGIPRSVGLPQLSFPEEPWHFDSLLREWQQEHEDQLCRAYLLGYEHGVRGFPRLVDPQEEDSEK